LCSAMNFYWFPSNSLRVPKYAACLEFVNFALLLFTFVMCLSSLSCCSWTIHISHLTMVIDEDGTQVTSWEAAFIVFAVAFTLAEYTSSTEHGWISALFPSSMHTCPWLTSSIVYIANVQWIQSWCLPCPNNLCYVDVECLRLFVHRHFPCISLPQDQRAKSRRS